jgi:hypothetical protein
VNHWFQRVVLARRWLCFIVLCLSFFAFGAGTFNLFVLLKMNTALIAEHGWQALADGAAQQFVELMLTGLLSIAAWIVFKACEHRLVHWLNEE